MSGGGKRKKQKRPVNGHEAEAEAVVDAATEREPGTHESGVETIAPVDSEPPPAQTAASESDSVSDTDSDSDSVSAAEASAHPPAQAADLDRQRQKAVLESLIFVAERPVTPMQLARAMKVRVALVRELVPELMQDYQTRGIELIEVASGYQFRSAAACAPFVREFVSQKPVRLTRAQLETLALISYREPITRPEIDEVRGVDSGSAIRVLLERSLIKMLGRKDEPGRPLLYGTSSHFLEFFGMRSLKDLPTLREFTELSDENRALFKRKTGESVEDAEAELLAADEAARAGEDQIEHISDEDLAELAAEAETDIPPPPDMHGTDPEPEAGESIDNADTP